VRRKLREIRVRAGTDVLRSAGNPDVPSARNSTVAAAGNRAATHEHPAIPQPIVNPSRFIEPTWGVRFDQPNFSAPSSKHSSK